MIELTPFINPFIKFTELIFPKREVTISIDSNMNEVDKNSIIRWSLTYEIESRSDKEIFVKELYVELPKRLNGNSQANPTLTEHFGVRGKYFLNHEPFTFKHFVKKRFEITDKSILAGVVDKGYLRLIIYSSQIGKIKSNKIKLGRQWLIWAGLIESNWFDRILGRKPPSIKKTK